MNLTLSIKNADENLLKAIKSIIKLCPNAKLKIEKEPNSELMDAISEARAMRKNSDSYKSYESAKELIEDCING